jgi:hypothetical protein
MGNNFYMCQYHVTTNHLTKPSFHLLQQLIISNIPYSVVILIKQTAIKTNLAQAIQTFTINQLEQKIKLKLK